MKEENIEFPSPFGVYGFLMATGGQRMGDIMRRFRPLSGFMVS